MEISVSRRHFPSPNPTFPKPLKDQTLKSVRRYYCNLSSEVLKSCIQSHLIQISELRRRICELICRSKFFEVGNQGENAPLVFQGFLNHPSEVKSLVHEQSYRLIPRFDSDAALYEYLFTLYTIHEGSDRGLGALQDLLKQNLVSTQKRLIDILRKEGHRFAQNAQVSDPDSPYASYLPSFLSTHLFAQCSAALQDIYRGLLAIEWMEKENTLIAQYRENASKYDYVFSPYWLYNENSCSPYLRLQNNSDHLPRLEREVSMLISSSYFFQYGEQQDDEHFQDFFQSFIAHLRGVESIVQRAADYFVKHYPRYRDTSFSEGPHLQLIKDLNSILETNQGLKRRFLEALRKEKRILKKSIELPTHHPVAQTFIPGPKFTDVDISPHHSFPVYLVKHLLGWGPRYAQILQDIFTKLLVMTWLEEDSKELNVYLGLKEPVSDALPEVPSAFIFQEKIYGLRSTKPDGTCGLHALLGELNEGEYVCLEDPRQAFIQKIRENFQDARVKGAILEILLGYLNAQEDPSSKMLFESPEGNRLNQAFLEIRNRFQTQVKALKEEEASLWLQEMPSIREKVLEEARKSAQYAEMEEEAILNALRESKLKLLDLISPEREPFSRLLGSEKKGQIVSKALEQQEALERWSDAEAHFLTNQLYPHYLIALASGEFFLNTQEVALAALLFHKKAQVVHAGGAAATEVIFPDGEGEPTIIYHEGCHFSRCTPCTQEETAILTDPEKLRRVNQKNQDTFDYMQAKSLADQQRRKDLYLLQRYRSSLKEEAAQFAVSGGLSIFTGNPLPIIMQLSRTTINTAGSYIDPLGESQEVQVLKLLGNSGFVHLLGGNMLQLGTALAVDLASLATQEKNKSKNKNTARNLGFGILKGALTRDPEKFFKQAWTTILSETGRNLVSEEDTSDGWKFRLLRALCTNADLQGALVDSAFKDSFKEPTKPKFNESPDPEEQAKYPQQVPSKDSEEQKAPLPNPEIQRLLDDAVLEHSKEDAIYKDKQLGTKEAKEYRDEKHQNWDEKWKHGTRKEEKKAWGKYEGATIKVADAVELESKHKVIVDGLNSKIKALREKLYTPIAEKASKEPQGQSTEKSLPQKNTPVSSAPDRSHLLDSQPSPVSLNVEVVAEKESTGNGGYYLIYHLILNHEGHAPKDIGKFTSKSKALGAAEALNSLSRQIDTQNQESYRLQAQYEALGINPKELPTTLHFKQMYFEIEASKEKVKLYLNGQKVFETKDAGKALDILKQKGAQQIRQNSELLGTYKNIVGERAPVHIEAPKGHLAAPIDSKDSKYHHLSYVDAQGKTQTLGKYQKGDDAKHVAGGWAHFQVTTLSQETQMFDAQQKLASQGIPIEEIPQRPSLETPTIDGTNSDKNFGKIQASRVRNEKAVQAYLQKLEGLAKEPLNPQGLTPSEIQSLKTDMMPKIKDPKEHGFCYKAYRKPGQKLTEFKNWTDEKGIQVSGGEIGRASFDLYQTKDPRSTSYDPGNYGIPQGPAPIQSSQWTWQDMQNHQTQKIFEMNMAYQSPSQPTSAPLDYSWMVPEGMTPNYQLPSTDLSSLGRNSSPSMSPQVPQRPLQLAGLFPYISGGAQSDPVQKLLVNDFTKSVPKGPMKVAAAIMSLMLPDMSDIKGAECPKAHFKRVANNVFQKYDQIVEIQNPNGFGARAGEFVGEMVALGGIGKVIRVAEGISVFGMACEGGFIGGVIAEAHDTNKVAGVAFGFAGGAGTGKLMKFLFRTRVPQPLIDRALTIKPEAFSQEIRAIEAMQQPFYRSGFVTDKTAMKLAAREISPVFPTNTSGNNSYISFLERGKARVISISDMSKAGQLSDKGKEVISKAGRALQKHSERPNPSFPKPTGNVKEVSAQGQKYLDEILNHPEKVISIEKPKSLNFEVLDVFIPGKYGARFTKDGKKMIGFLEPPRGTQ